RQALCPAGLRAAQGSPCSRRTTAAGPLRRPAPAGGALPNARAPSSADRAPSARAIPCSAPNRAGALPGTGADRLRPSRASTLVAEELGPAPIKGERRRVRLQRRRRAGKWPLRLLLACSELVAQAIRRRHALQVVLEPRPDFQVVLLEHARGREHP